MSNFGNKAKLNANTYLGGQFYVQINTQAERVPDAKLPMRGDRLQIEAGQGWTLRVQSAGQEQ